MTHSTPHRNWFITGASSGMGLALTKAAINRGDNVVGLSRNPEPLKDIAGAHPEQLLTLRADIRNQSEVDAAVEQGLAKFGRIDVLVNGAGYGIWGAVEEATDAQVRAAFGTNVFGTLNVLRAVLPSLRTQRSGHVVQIAAYRGQSSSPGMGLISAFNYAKEGLSDGLYEELKPLGIHVTIVEPAPSATGFRANLDRAPEIADYDQTVRAALAAIRALPAEHFSLPEPIATAILAAVDADEPPLRLATGSVAVNTIRKTLQSRLANLEAWEAVSVAVDGDPDRVCPLD
ncbi:cis-2,3-dihydrobiphenyl-2,3-diol dehydrogenase [Mycobacterium florentinum]|uniref:Cis-2,3-dihydrobiphenyl-2,3-diol dehydrogenase n=1 Tax=Mycobacterium florentinum TaxID=292462 RepID=A0A1X1TVE4_MYCFL|nr:SDR family NAD(P)-dependent oxidoreductase [Mycobacterium florentinum]MCV7408984.1 SDR family NAD(P)-dependent oxidoreductase [Mycobacterium florentinum]ORV48553.1 cis-2,3-dihydrobiphenyl-2,3-diol dehydrogenase [Mycobacterium florentinum]BBX77778.1 short-chain dehydrogenase/reductase [Mycobacterium florentinum]